MIIRLRGIEWPSNVELQREDVKVGKVLETFEAMKEGVDIVELSVLSGLEPGFVDILRCDSKDSSVVQMWIHELSAYGVQHELFNFR